MKPRLPDDGASSGQAQRLQAGLLQRFDPTDLQTHTGLMATKTPFHLRRTTGTKRELKRECDVPHPSCKHTPGWNQTRTASTHCHGGEKNRVSATDPSLIRGFFDGIKKIATSLLFQEVGFYGAPPPRIKAFMSACVNHVCTTY